MFRVWWQRVQTRSKLVNQPCKSISAKLSTCKTARMEVLRVTMPRSMGRREVANLTRAWLSHLTKKQGRSASTTRLSSWEVSLMVRNGTLSSSANQSSRLWIRLSMTMLSLPIRMIASSLTSTGEGILTSLPSSINQMDQLIARTSSTRQMPVTRMPPNRLSQTS